MIDFDELKKLQSESVATPDEKWRITKLRNGDIAIETDDANITIVYPEGLLAEVDAQYIVALHNKADELIGLAERALEFEESYRCTISEKCNPMDDRAHCSCVPALKGRIQKLEQEVTGAMLADVSNAEGLQVTIVQLEDRVRKLKAALKVYADPKNWSRSSRFYHSVVFTGKLRLKDIYGGAIAHRAMRSAVK